MCVCVCVFGWVGHLAGVDEIAFLVGSESKKNGKLFLID